MEFVRSNAASVSSLGGSARQSPEVLCTPLFGRVRAVMAQTCPTCSALLPYLRPVASRSRGLVRNYAKVESVQQFCGVAAVAIFSFSGIAFRQPLPFASFV